MSNYALVLIIDIRKGKYDGIVAWNPDRLARNMLEAGEIIDMIDTNIIKDLKFATHHFTKDANGKMLLGMAFVLSKQYSNDLSQKVTRGVRRSLDEGKTGTPKYGYERSEQGMYVPDVHNFEIVCEAWEMRKNGETLDIIAKTMNEKGFYRLIKSTGKKQVMTKQKLSKTLFPDPFYYGILVQTEQTVDLRTIYNFEPATTEADYLTVQAMNNSNPTYKKDRNFNPFRKMILCSFCNNHMYVGAGSKPYLYARCDTEGCTRSKRSIRVKFILHFLYTFLEGGLNFTEKEYADYNKKMKGYSTEKRLELKTLLHSKQASLKQIESEISDRSLQIIKFSEKSPIYKANEKKIHDLQDTADKLEKEIIVLKKSTDNPQRDEMTIDEFLNFSKEASAKLQAGNPIEKDQIARKIFLNLTVDEEKVVSYQLKEPFATLLKTRKIHSGRDGGT